MCQVCDKANPCFTEFYLFICVYEVQVLSNLAVGCLDIECDLLRNIARGAVEVGEVCGLQ